MLSGPVAPTSTVGIVQTGIPGLDDVLAGGLTPDQLYLIEGVPGSGKTTLALRFLMEGARIGDRTLYVTLSESESELRAVAASHGWDLDGVTIRELAVSEASLKPDDRYSMFHPSEIELSETTETILSDVERLRPTRIVFDSLSELRLLAGNSLRYRRQILALKQFFQGRHCTVLLLDDVAGTDHDLQIHSLAHGAIRLEQLHPEFGAERRRLLVLKYRGRQFRGGYHDYVIARGGLVVYPRLVASEHRGTWAAEPLSTGVGGLDELMGGGVERGSSTLIVGAAGSGKSTIAAQVVAAAAARGIGSAIFAFDESPRTLLTRAAGMGIELEAGVASGLISIKRVDPAELSPGELIHHIRAAVNERHVGIVVIDSLNGYLNAMPEERFLVMHLHEVLSYLGDAGIATILIGAHQGLIGSQMVAPVDATYLADAVILLRYFELDGDIRQAISVVKKRTGGHERTLREFKLDADGIHLGPALRGFRGVLTGVPALTNSPTDRETP